MSPKVLTLDIETSPNLGYIWSLWKQNVSLTQLKESGEVICLATKWLHEKQTHFIRTDGEHKEAGLAETHALLSEADRVVTWNGTTFDIPHLNREFLEHGFDQPAPYANVDLLRTAKKQFRFVSNKLDYVAQRLGVGAKLSHTGFQLWLDCMAGDEKAWKLMERYNRQDVVVTEKLYTKLLPWITGMPAAGLYSTGNSGCGNCGAEKLVKRGFAHTAVSTYQRLQCGSCGKWSREARRLGGTDIRGIG